MTEGQKALDSGIAEVQNLQKVFTKLKTPQITSTEYKQLAKATSFAWFNKHREPLVLCLGEDAIKDIDDSYRVIITAVSRATTRIKYLELIKKVKKSLEALQAKHAVELAQAPLKSTSSTSDAPPSFSPLISDSKMQAILAKRWTECSVCVSNDAPLAATVMMGGLLEGLLLAKINQTSDKSKIFGSTAAPKDKVTGKALPLTAWGLKNYIDVAHEVGWITKTTKDIGEVVRDYRNFIHPQKELSHGIVLVQGDAKMLWEVAKSITHQLLIP